MELLVDGFFITSYFLVFHVTYQSYPPMAMKISFTFIDVFADVSINSKLLSSAYDWASCQYKVITGISVTAPRHIHTCRSPAYGQQLDEQLVCAHLEVDGPLVGQVGFVA